MLDGLCGYLIARYPVLDENRYSGYVSILYRPVRYIQIYNWFHFFTLGNIKI